ncbi:hypothetical protein [Pseudoxanthomonas indica]|uniref:Uncharacterized protein n=1 Tax=Pseudoxanthomonas indica TaxID=428993 RepID=A0A1T5L9H0_9GAMM|nr:hypothetical protein [Pseudoxanthomonas indica]GGD32311.1 hypothetical protein GCM10007235_00280 [Pseudoxanthomonas indica]SKC72590.1 hypothetical protein SAMN06296058_2158 [Pseudoxanthomonas indica]
MHSLILLYDAQRFEREQAEQAPDLLERDGLQFSRRAGPRTPLRTDHDWNPVSVYAPDDLSEEEFQELYEQHRAGVEELHLHY